MTGNRLREMRRGGGKFTAAVRHAILGAIRAGASYGVAARSGGIAPNTLSTWLRRGEYESSCGSDSEYARFAEEFAEADANVIRKVESNVMKATETDWRAGRFILSKRVPEVYGDKDSAHLIAQRVSDWILEQIRTQCDAGTYSKALAAISGAVEVEAEELPANVPEKPQGSASAPHTAPQGTSEDAAVIEVSEEPEREPASGYVPAIMRGKEPVRKGGNFDTSEGKFGLKEPGKKRRK